MPKLVDSQLAKRAFVVAQVNGFIEDAWRSVGPGDAFELNAPPARGGDLMDGLEHLL